MTSARNRKLRAQQLAQRARKRWSGHIPVTVGARWYARTLAECPPLDDDDNDDERSRRRVRADWADGGRYADWEGARRARRRFWLPIWSAYRWANYYDVYCGYSGSYYG